MTARPRADIDALACTSSFLGMPVAWARPVASERLACYHVSMSGLCSFHPHAEPGCPACAARAEDVLPGYAQKLAEAEAAGLVDCGTCGFSFYRTTETCPACSGWTWLDGGHRVIWPFHTRGHVGFGDQTYVGAFEYAGTRP